MFQTSMRRLRLAVDSIFTQEPGSDVSEHAVTGRSRVVRES